jgi:hypothetical protein
MQFAIPSHYFLDPKSDSERERRLSREADDALQRERRLFCARCHHAVTHQDQRIAVSGGQEHDFTNPHGFSFRIGCFREASGCVATGERTTEHTWFPGYAWQVAQCERCGIHLGWLFASSADGFYGLIIERLTSAGSASH